MTFRPLRYIGDPVLTTPCAEVTVFDDKLARLVDDLIENVKLPGRAGLAAPQIGVGMRVFSYFTAEDELGYVVNPRIVELSEDLQEGEEGCLSVPDLAYPLTRAWWARCVGVDVNGDEVEVAGEGLLARALQHETDHLDGMLYLDRLSTSVRRTAMRDVREAPWFGTQPSSAGGLLGR